MQAASISARSRTWVVDNAGSCAARFCKMCIRDRLHGADIFLGDKHLCPRQTEGLAAAIQVGRDVLTARASTSGAEAFFRNGGQDGLRGRVQQGAGNAA